MGWIGMGWDRTGGDGTGWDGMGANDRENSMQNPPGLFSTRELEYRPTTPYIRERHTTGLCMM